MTKKNSNGFLLDTEKYSQFLLDLSLVLKKNPPFSKETEYLEKMKELNGWSDEQLIDEINRYSREKIEESPDFYRALADTVLKRAAYNREEDR